MKIATLGLLLILVLANCSAPRPDGFCPSQGGEDPDGGIGGTGIVLCPK